MELALLSHRGPGWFLSYHVFTRYVKVTFFPRRVPAARSARLRQGQDARWVDIHEGELDEAQLAAWVRQAAALPGWDLT